MVHIGPLVKTQKTWPFLRSSSCTCNCQRVRITVHLIGAVPTVPVSVTSQAEVQTFPLNVAVDLGVIADQRRTGSLVTAVLAVSVSVTLVVGVSALSLAGAAELRGRAHLGRTGSLVTEVITVCDLVTLPGLGDTEAGTEAAELLLAAGLVRGDLDDNLVRIVSTVICSIMFLLAWNTPSVITPELCGLA